MPRGRLGADGARLRRICATRRGRGKCASGCSGGELEARPDDRIADRRGFEMRPRRRHPMRGRRQGWGSNQATSKPTAKTHASETGHLTPPPPVATRPPGPEGQRSQAARAGPSMQCSRPASTSVSVFASLRRAGGACAFARASGTQSAPRARATSPRASGRAEVVRARRQVRTEARESGAARQASP